MKTLKRTIVAAGVAVTLLTVTSCKKTFYTDVNNNPNQPTVVPPSTILPGIEVSLAYAQGGDAARYASLFIQQGYGANREANAYYNYQLSGTNLPEQLWDNMYSPDMNNAYTLMNMASSGGYNEYAGIANILMAYSLQVTCDFWGPIPYSQAFKGAANIDPAYDADATVYSDIIGLCNTGIADLNAAPGALIPTTDDVIYGGNATSWIAFATAIKARVYIHQTKIGSAAMADSAFNCAQRALADGFTTAQVTFTGAPNSTPMYQFNTGWGDITYTNAGGPSTMFDTMIAYTDPRISCIFDTTAGGGTIGMNNTTDYYSKATSPVEFITPEELDFIEAEAALKQGLPIATVQTYYTAALTANFNKLASAAPNSAAYTAGVTAYMASQGVIPATANTAEALHMIAVQEWIALFNNPEAWTTWRRTGYPFLVAPATAVFNQIPRRMVLPNSETTENSNSPKNETLWNPVLFWD